MADTNLAVRIAAILDASGFNKAEKKVNALDSTVKKLGKTLGLALGTAAIVSFGKSAVKAFMEDEKSAAMLANTVKNLGMAMELPEIETFIANMEKATGIADDKLRPAMQSLLTTFQNTADAESMLGLATEVARGSGQDLSTVVADLTKAYTGQTKGLEKYKLGLTAAELKTMSFEDIMKRFNKQFKGSNAAYLDTYAGKMEALSTAAGTAKEIIGKGLVDALIAVTGSIDVQDLSTKLISFAQNLADAFVKVGNLIYQNWAILKSFGIALVAVFTATKVYAAVGAFLGFLKKLRAAWVAIRAVSIGAAIAQMAAMNPWAALAGGAALVASIYGAVKLIEALTPKGDTDPFVMPDFEGLQGPQFKKVKADKLKLAKLDAKIAADKAKRDKAAAIFDMDKIQLIAALKGQVSQEDRNRLELQLALATDNTTEVTRLTKQISIAQGYTQELTDYLLNLPEANNPFVAWKGYLDEIELQAKRIAAFKVGDSMTPQQIVAQFPSPSLTQAQLELARESGQSYGSGNNGIVIQIDGKNVVDAVVGQAMSGNNAYLNRRLGGFD